MSFVIEFSYGLAAMAVLILCSAFFSGSEAALFYLRRPDRRSLQSGHSAQRLAAALLDEPERLLTSVLFWNLVINITYFAIVSIIGIHLENEDRRTEAGAFVLGALLLIIFFSETLPKNLAVLRPQLIATMVSVPLAAAVRCLDPLMSTIHFINLISRRLIWPKFEPEPYLELSDLERAIEHSTSDADLLEQEQTVLQNIVAISDVRVEELMRPRTQFLSFRPPVSRSDLKGQMPPSGYLLVTEPDSDEVAAAVVLKYLSDLPEQHLEHYAETVLYVPWCSTVDSALDEMLRFDREVASVVNEFGETVGILTFDDILDTIFGASSSRSARLFQKSSISHVHSDVWQVTGMTSLRRLARHFRIQLPESKSVTVAGVLQEVLQRLPRRGDQCQWGPFLLEVLDASARGDLTIQLIRSPNQDEMP